MSLGVRLMNLAAGLEKGLGDEFAAVFDEFDELGGHFLVCLREKGAEFDDLGARQGAEFDEFGGAFDEFGLALGAGAWR